MGEYPTIVKVTESMDDSKYLILNYNNTMFAFVFTYDRGHTEFKTIRHSDVKWLTTYPEVKIDDFKYTEQLMKFCYFAYEYHYKIERRDLLYNGLETIMDVLLRNEITDEEVEFLNTVYAKLKEEEKTW